MKRKVYLTLKEQQEPRSNYLSWHNLTDCDIVTVDDDTKLKLDRIRNRTIGLWYESTLSKNHKENVAERLIRLVKFAMGAARQTDADCSPIKAVSILRGQSGLFGMGAFDLEECFGVFANAVTDGDSELFLALAKLLKSPPVKHGLDALVIHAHQAYDDLQQEGIALPTKKQVVERAIYACAKARVLAGVKYNNSPYNWKERDDSQFPVVLREAIQKETKKLKERIEQKEARFWSNTGLKDLPKADKKSKKRAGRLGGK